jgi:hypothetical protein
MRPTADQGGHQTEAALLCFLFFQRPVNLALRVHYSGLHRKGLAGPDPTASKVRGPLKARGTGRLNDGVLDASVFHATSRRLNNRCVQRRRTARRGGCSRITIDLFDLRLNHAAEHCWTRCGPVAQPWPPARVAGPCSHLSSRWTSGRGEVRAPVHGRVFHSSRFSLRPPQCGSLRYRD